MSPVLPEDRLIERRSLKIGVYASALMAARIEVMTREVASRSGGRLEAVLREDVECLVRI